MEILEKDFGTHDTSASFPAEAAALLRAALHDCPLGIIVVGAPPSRFECINQSGLAILGLQPEPVRAESLGQLLAESHGLGRDGSPLAAMASPLQECLRRGEASQTTFSIVGGNSPKTIALQAAPVFYQGAIRGVMAVFDDITKSTELKNEIKSITVRLENLWRVSKNKPMSIKSVCDVALEAIVELTQSKYGFYGFLNEHEDTMSIHAWSGETMKGCMILDKPFVYHIREAGIWAEAVRKRRPFVLNDYASCKLPKKGYPLGHVYLTRLLVVPYFIDNKIHSVAAVANKKFDYTSDDITKITEFLNDIQHVIKQIEAEKLLKKSEEKYRKLVELMNEGILTLDVDLVVTYVNSKMCKILGYDKDEIVGFEFKKFLHQDSLEEFYKQQSYRQKGASDPYEIILINHDGEKVFVLSSPTPMIDENQTCIGSYEVITNISNIKLIEMQLLHAQKMESLGSMAAGIAHEINTPLQYIISNTDFIKGNFSKLLELTKDIRDALNRLVSDSSDNKLQALAKRFEDLDLDFVSEEIPSALKESMAGLHRIASIVLSVKNFAQQEFNVFKAVDINEEIKNTVTISKNEWKYVADVTLQLDQSLRPVMCLPSDFNQCILNLIINAAQAIKTKYESSSVKGRITITTAQDDSSVLITIADNGIGIANSVKNKIFNPFFTTKEVGQGTGMGLAIVFKIIEKHHGKIWFTSKEGEGTAFFMQLPSGQSERPPQGD